MAAKRASQNTESHRFLGYRARGSDVPTPARALAAYFALVFAISCGAAGIYLCAPSLLQAFKRWPAATSPPFYLAVYAPSMAAVAITDR